MNLFYIIGISAMLNLGMFMTSAQSEMFIYPKDGQSLEQQELDEFQCYKWAKERTGVDPNQPVQSTASSSTKRKSGGILGGAMGGAALGAIGGAIAGNAGKGAAIGAGVGAGGSMLRNKRARGEAEQRQQQATAQQQQSRQDFNRAYGVCLEGRGYKVG
jgi:predicted lipid-binding transport protein (Tim44 family)